MTALPPLSGKANFRSTDSLAGGLALPASRSRAFALLLLFAVVALLQLWLFASGHIDFLLPARDYVFGPYTGARTFAVRTFILSFYVAFASYASGSVRARVLLGLTLVLRFLALCALLDLGSVALLVYVGVPYPLTVLEMLAGVLGFAVFAAALLERGAMPEAVAVVRGPQHYLRSYARLWLVGLVALGFTIQLIVHPGALITTLRSLSLLGGIGPGVVMFLLLVFLQLYVVSELDARRLARADFAAPLTVIVPAYNESYIIADTIEHIDAAARQYAEAVELLILDNNSNDDTHHVAQAAIAAVSGISARVISVPTPGKAHALNAGVEAARTAFIVRIDADTQVFPDTFALAMQHFADPEVGAVGGVPEPPGKGPFDGARLVEVLIKHGYYSPALSSMSGLVGIPGMFVIYRAEALRKAGVFPSGMNGEDTDISLRIAELGYRTYVDHKVRYVSEVPTSFAHLREQRVRWFRSIYHVSARARSLIVSPNFSVRGKLVLPYMLINNARRAMMLPLIIFGLFQYMITSNGAPIPNLKSVGAVLLGSPALVALLAIILNRRPRALLWLPAYIVFRALRSWYTLESALTIPILLRSRRIRLRDMPMAPGGIPPSAGKVM